MSLSEFIPGAAIRSITGKLPPIDCLIRQPNGEWTGRFKLDGVAELADGRRVVFGKEVAAKANQQLGRRPRRTR